MPRSLFLKIFLWFGAVVLTFIVATSIAGELMHLHFEPRHRPPDAILTSYAKDATEEYERGGQAALAAYLESVQEHSGTRLFLFNEQLQEVSFPLDTSIDCYI